MVLNVHRNHKVLLGTGRGGRWRYAAAEGRPNYVDHFALRPQKRGGLLGTGTGGVGGGEDERVKARPRIPPERDWTAARTMEVLK